MKPNSRSEYVSAVSRVKCMEGFCTFLLKHLVLVTIGELVLSKPWVFSFTSKVSVITVITVSADAKIIKTFYHFIWLI